MLYPHVWSLAAYRIGICDGLPAQASEDLRSLVMNFTDMYLSANPPAK